MQRPVDADISTVKTAFCGSSPLPVELYKRFEEACGVEVIEGYGLTEATCLVSINPIGGVKKIGSIGIPFPYTDVKILMGTADGVRECATDVLTHKMKRMLICSTMTAFSERVIWVVWTKTVIFGSPVGLRI